MTLQIWPIDKATPMSARTSRSKYICKIYKIYFVFYLEIVHKLDNVHRVKVKVKFPLQPVMKTQMVSSGIALHQAFLTWSSRPPWRPVNLNGGKNYNIICTKI